MAYVIRHNNGEELYVAVMNKQEAEVLGYILAHVSGSEDGPRTVTQQILSGMSDEGIDWYQAHINHQISGSLEINQRARRL